MSCSGCGQNTSSANLQTGNITVTSGIKKNISEKLGRCWKCILIASLGTALGWFLIYIVFIQISNPPIMLSIMAVICAGSFTVAFIAHLIAYLVKRKTNNLAKSQD